MNYGEIITADCANGTGIRISLFVSGCRNHCKDCFQPETWDFSYGLKYIKDTEDFILKEISHDYYDGLTILGGEPFEEENQLELVHLIRRMRKEQPSKTIWIFTGYIYEKLASGECKHTDVTDEILDSIDVLVDGRFVSELKSLQLKFRGSENQRILDMKQTRKNGHIIMLID